MGLIEFSIAHQQTFEQAQAKLKTVVEDVQRTAGPLLGRVEWSADGSSAKLFGPGIEVQLTVDPQRLSVVGDIPLVGKLLGNKLLQTIKGRVEDTFQRRIS